MSLGASPIQRVARLERLLALVRYNAAQPRLARSPVVHESDAPEVSVSPQVVGEVLYDDDIDDVADIEVVEIDAEGSMPPPAVPAHPASSAPVPRDHSHRPTAGAYSLSFPPGDTGEASFGEEIAIPLQTKRESDRPTALALDPSQPTMEQLGATIGLEEPPSGSLPDLALELESLPPSEGTDLEVSLPGKAFAGAFDENLLPPESAASDLAAFMQDGQQLVDAAAQAAPGGMAPHVVERDPTHFASPVAEIIDDRVLPQVAFSGLLDDSLHLRRE